MSAGVAALANFAPREPVTEDAVVTEYPQKSAGESVAEPVVLLTGTPVITLVAGGITQVPVSAPDTPKVTPLLTFEAEGKLVALSGVTRFRLLVRLVVGTSMKVLVFSVAAQRQAKQVLGFTPKVAVV